jgi:hypothetical protein
MCAVGRNEESEGPRTGGKGNIYTQNCKTRSLYITSSCFGTLYSSILGVPILPQTGQLRGGEAVQNGAR